MSAITAKALNSTIGKSNYIGIDEILKPLSNLVYVPSEIPVVELSRYETFDSSPDFLPEKKLAQFTLEHGGTLYIDGEIESEGLRLTANKKFKRSIKTAPTGGSKYYITFEPDTTFEIFGTPTLESGNRYKIFMNISFSGELKFGHDILIEPIEFEYTPLA